MKTIFLLNGQGSQFYHMGESYYKENQLFKESLLMLENRVKQLFNLSVLEKVMDKSKKIKTPFEDLTISNLSIFFIQYGLFKVLEASGIRPDKLIGVSFGECSCAILSNTISLDEGLQIIYTQSEYLKRNTGQGFLINVYKDKVQELKADNVFLAGHFSENNYLVAVGERVVAEKVLNESDNSKKNSLLPVRIPFHSCLIDPFREEYLKLVERREITYSTPLFECYSAGYTKKIDYFSDNHFWSMIRNPINFKQTIYQLEEKGNYRYIELGATSNLARAVRMILSEKSNSEVVDLMGPFINTDKSLKEITGKE